MTSKSPHNLKILLISILVDLLGFTAIIPLFPGILAYYEKTDTSNSFQVLYQTIVAFRSKCLNAPEILTNPMDSESPISLDSILLGGFLGSWFSLLQCVSNPIYTQKFRSSKSAILVSLSGSILASVIWYYSKTFSMFLLARTLGGLFEGNVSISITILGQIKEDVTKRKAMAFVGVCYSLAFIFGPLIGVRLSKFYADFYQMPAVFSATCSLLALLIIFFKYEDEEIIKDTTNINTTDNQRKTNFSTKSLYLIYFVYLVGFSGIEFSLGFLFLQKFNLDRMAQGRIYATLGLLMAIVQGGVVRKRAGLPLAKKCLILLFVSFSLMTFDNFNLVLLGLILKAVSAAAMVPSFNFIASNSGYDLAKLRSSGALARAIGPISFCSFYWILGSEVCFALGAFVMLTSFSLLRKVDESKAKAE